MVTDLDVMNNAAMSSQMLSHHLTQFTMLSDFVLLWFDDDRNKLFLFHWHLVNENQHPVCFLSIVSAYRYVCISTCPAK